MVSQSVFSAEKQVADLVGEDRIRYDQFRRLLNGGQPEEFYAFTQDYEKELKTKGYMMLYYKLKTNEGFFALGHRQLFRAMQYAEELDKEVREAGASDYFYLATGLFAEIYNHSLDSRKAEKFYMQTLNEVGDRDPKFTMQMYLSLAQLLSMRNSEKALQWLDKSIAMSQKLKIDSPNSLVWASGPKDSEQSAPRIQVPTKIRTVALWRESFRCSTR